MMVARTKDHRVYT